VTAPLLICDSEFGILVHWMLERDRIRALKDSGAMKPWTSDPLLRDYRWCNVRRMDDRVSRWLLENWYDDRHDPEYQLKDALFARLINWPEALAELSDYRELSFAHRVLTARAARGEKVFTGAYIVPGVPGKNKVDSTIDLIATVSNRELEILNLGSMRATWAALIKFDGLGSFLAGQIVSDLATLGIGAEWPDRETWAPIGPGSARGLNRLRELPLNRNVTQAEFERYLPELIAMLRPHVAELWNDRGLVAMDIQNCLCEFDKYRRLQLAQGKVRARYDGIGRPQGNLL
jgi:hypothetical protein